MLTQANLTSFVTYNPIALPVETRLAEAVQTLAQTGIHHWPVVNAERQLVGILSERDIVRVLTQQMRTPVAVGDSAPAQTDDLSVADTMSSVVEFVTLDESPRQVLTKLLEHTLDWLPVVQDEMVVGVTTMADFLREFSYGQIGLSKTQVSELMVPAEIIDSEMTLSEAWDALTEHQSDCVGVVRGDLPLGVLSQRDVRLAMCRVAVADWLGDQPNVYEFECSGPRTVLELVSSAPTIRPGARLQSAATLMLDHGREAIAVVNQANRMMGAVTEHEILQRMLNYLI
ncbi:MAG TPA: CBS domain-containing protein [Pirellulaceae bacterium]|nr:CBS domain-containing protein [Pirellulaceae bacterium]